MRHDLACLGVGGGRPRVKLWWDGMNETRAELGYVPRNHLPGIPRLPGHPAKHKHGADKASKLNSSCLVGAYVHPTPFRSLTSFGALQPLFPDNLSSRTMVHCLYLTTDEALMPYQEPRTEIRLPLY